MPDPHDSPNIDDVTFPEGARGSEPGVEDWEGEDAFEDARSRHLDQTIKDLESLRDLRERFALRVYAFMVGWALVVLVFLVLQGFEIYGFVLPTAVMTTLVGGTTVSVIGLVGFIVQGLFPRGTTYQRQS